MDTAAKVRGVHSLMADAHVVPRANRVEVRVTADSHSAWLRTRFIVECTRAMTARNADGLGIRILAKYASRNSSNG